MTEHVETRNRLQEVEYSDFYNLLDRCMDTRSGDNRSLMELHYVEKKDFRYIGDLLGYSEGAIKKRHRKILKKLKKFL